MRLQSEELPMWTSMLKHFTLILVCILAFSIRLFAVLRYESVIHEFDPYFNYRATKYLTTEGFWEFIDWFDDRSWYPLGRVVGGTIYPGLMVTAAALFHSVRWFGIPLNIRDMCVFLAPIFSAFTALAVFLLTEEVAASVTNSTDTSRSLRRGSFAVSPSAAGLLAAALVAVVPAYISRSVGGSYDNEGVAIFALVLCFYLWIKSVNTGSSAWAGACAVGYFYMTASWGGHVFVINIIPLYVCVMMLCSRYSSRLYTAYSIFYCLGLLLAMTVPFVGMNVIFQAETQAAHGVFAAVQVYACVLYVSSTDWYRSRSFGWWRVNGLKITGGVLLTLLVAVVGYLQYSGMVHWSGRSLSLLNPMYATKYIPIIASVSEHQPTTWTAFFFDLHVLVVLAPLGVLVLYAQLSDASIFILLYGAVAWYFAGAMVRLMLTLAPIACVLGGIGCSSVLVGPLRSIKTVLIEKMEDILGDITAVVMPGSVRPVRPAVRTKLSGLSMSLSGGVVALVMAVLYGYGFHAAYASSLAYSSPSVVVDMGKHPVTGERVIYDDFREAYSWLRFNTPEDARILSWWDYGYQLASMSNRTVLVDNNTWNNTHIATVGRVLASSEEEAYPILESLRVDYVLVIFGGVSGYASDDINKFLWPVRIGSLEFPDSMPKEQDYFSDIGEFDIGPNGAPALHNSVAYKLCYYNFNLVHTESMQPSGFDRARGRVIRNETITLTTMDEAFTSEHWMVRIYKVKRPEHLNYGLDPHPRTKASATKARAKSLTKSKSNSKVTVRK